MPSTPSHLATSGHGPPPPPQHSPATIRGWRWHTDALARSWKLLVLRGLVGIVFGVAAIVWPGLTLIVLVTMFGIYAIVDGAVAILSVVNHSERGRWWAVLLEGILGIGAGLAALLIPGITAVVLVLVIGAWAILTGVMELIAAFRLRREMEDEWLLGLAGILSLVFGLVIVAFPGAGALALVTLIGAYAIVFGLAMVLLGLRMRNSTAMPGRGLRLPA